jgi:peptide/nickel transport system permease protein
MDGSTRVSVLPEAVATATSRLASKLRKGLVGKLAFFVASGFLLLSVFFAVWPSAVIPDRPTYNPLVGSLRYRHKPPGYVDATGARHLLGTDHQGRDVWARIVYGARASMTVGFLGLIIGGVVGVLIGLIAGYRGGWFDRVAMRVVDAYLSFPYILLAIVWAAVVGTSILNLVLIVAVRGWVEFARVARGQALVVREREYIAAARALGASDWRLVLRHMLPNLTAPLLVVAGFQLGRLILLEATLSFLGMGIRPPTPAWGSMLSDARGYMNQAWWTIFFPGTAISLVVLSANFLGDSLRDRLDPALRGGT